MTAFLPQRDPRAHRRHRQLQEARGEYRYSYTHVSPLALVDNVPFQDQFSLRWLLEVGDRVLDTLANRAELERDARLRDQCLAKRRQLGELLARGGSALGSLKQVIAEALRLDGRLGAPADRARSLDEFAALFRTIGLPPIHKDCLDDRVFAWMRVAGPNPVMIRCAAEPDKRFPVTDAHLQITDPGDSLDAARAEGRLYLADYALLEGAKLGEFPHAQKYVYAPLALFLVHRANRELVPVAIQCRQKPAPNNPILTPDDGYNWLIAKTIVEVADGCVHEASTHLGRTHLLMEPFAVSTCRQLAASHPLYLLLTPHFEGTLAINSAAWQFLIADRGAVDKLVGAAIESTRALAVAGVRSASVMDNLLPKKFAARGVDDGQRLPQYPYRDDALLYWNAIQRWVGDYLGLYYQNDMDVQQDLELQAWSRELAAADGGRIAGLPNGGALKTTEELIAVVTFVLYTCSVQHAAVNFPQYDLMSYVPNMPLASYAPAPTTKRGATEADFLAVFPPLDMAELQLDLGYLLGTVHYTELGDYPHFHFRDHQVKKPLRAFQDRLSAIGDRIAERNRNRRPYEFLVPAGIPQSINI